MKICSTQFQPVVIPSDSEPSKVYTVTLRPVDSKFPACDGPKGPCMSFNMAKSRARKELIATGGPHGADVEALCKHIRRAQAGACDWTGNDDKTTCGRCGAPAVDIGAVKVATAPVVLPGPGPTPVVGGSELRPMLSNEVPAERIPTYVADDKWWAQLKINGHRVLIHVTPSGLIVLGRDGQVSQHSARFNQRAYADIFRLPTCVIDGELVGDTFHVFDLPYYTDGEITIDSPLRKRVSQLERLFDMWRPEPMYYRLVATARTELEKAELAVASFKANAEGVMLKHVDGKYTPGEKVAHQLKAKYTKTADVVVTKVGTAGKDNITYSVYDDQGVFKDNGGVKGCGIGKCSAIGKAAVSVGDVIEVRYSYVGENGRLVHPRMLRKRTDKQPAECVWSQFDHAHVNRDTDVAVAS